MVRTRFKKALLVAPEVFPDNLLTDYKNVKHISSVNSVFPSLHELNPDLIIFDYDYLAVDLEKVLRRLMANKFYEHLKICCYKKSANTKTDSLLKALGVDFLVYHEDMVKPQKSKSLLNNFHTILDTSILKWAGSVTNSSI